MQHSCKNTSSTCRCARTLHVKQEDVCVGGGAAGHRIALQDGEYSRISAPVSPADRPDDIIPNRAAWATEVGVACALRGRDWRRGPPIKGIIDH